MVVAINPDRSRLFPLPPSTPVWKQNQLRPVTHRPKDQSQRVTFVAGIHDRADGSNETPSPNHGGPANSWPLELARCYLRR